MLNVQNFEIFINCCIDYCNIKSSLINYYLVVSIMLVFISCFSLFTFCNGLSQSNQPLWILLNGKGPGNSAVPGKLTCSCHVSPPLCP